MKHFGPKNKVKMQFLNKHTTICLEISWKPDSALILANLELSID